MLPRRSPQLRADLEALLRERKLDRTLIGGPEGPPDYERSGDTAPFPRGQLSEVIGPASSGRTSLMLRELATRTQAGELTAIVDVMDRLDVPSAAAAGVDLERLLWVRGHMIAHSGFARDLNTRGLEASLRALALVLQSGAFGLVFFDVADVAPRELRRLPFTTWMRIERMLEGRDTACVLIATDHIARSARGVTRQITHESLCVPISARG